MLALVYIIIMGFTVNLYTLEKRNNSTKRPTGSGTGYECVLKHGSGILNPSISLNLGLTANPSSYNYAFIPAFGRYYFIEEWFWEDALWTATLKVDVLATYKTEIGDASLYVMRASNESNGAIIDTLYPSRTGCSYASDTKANPWNGASYVVGVITKYPTYGSLSYYVMTPAELLIMCGGLTNYEDLITTANGFLETDGSQALQLSLVDPLQYIKSCIMLPISNSEILNLDTLGDVYVYNWLAGSGRRVKYNSRIYKNYSFTIPKHPDTSSRGNYVNSAPFTSLILTIPPWGCIEIDTAVTCNATTLDVEVEVDPITGLGILVVKCNGIILNRIESQIGVSISLSSITKDYTGTTSLIKQGVGSLMSWGASKLNEAGFSTGSFGGVGDAMQSSTARAQTIGSQGNFVSNRGEFRLDAQFFRPVADDNAHNGRPLCAVRTLKNLGGYMLIQDGDVTINGTDTEDSQIRKFLESGFYYE